MDHFKQPDWCEDEYNPRVRVLDAERFGPELVAKSEAARKALGGEIDLAYGTGPREKLDLFRAKNSRGCVIYIHGGYWRAGDKSMYSWVAQHLNAAGLSVAVLGYPLCPDVTIPDIVTSCRKAVAALVKNWLSPKEAQHLTITGHSAGGYLTAILLTTDWAAFGITQPFHKAVPISGVFWLPPLVYTSMNQLIRMSEDQAGDWSLAHWPKPADVPVIPFVGGDESAEFHRQSAMLHTAWGESCATPIAVAGTNHFTVIEGLSDPSSTLFQTVAH